MIELHVDDGGDVDVGTADDDVEVGTLLVLRFWPGVVVGIILL